MLQKKCEKILMVYIEPTPYLLALIETLRCQFRGRIDILFLSENFSQYWNIESHKNSILSKNALKKLYQLVAYVVKGEYDCIHLAGWGSILFVLMVFISKFKKLWVTIESDTPIPHYEKPWKRIIKRLLYPFIFKFVDLFFPGGKKQAKYIEHYGVSSDFIYPVQMTVDVKSIKQHASTLSDSERQETRRNYNISEKDVVFLFVGRLETYKGIKDLICAFNNIDNETASLLIVGDGTLRNYIDQSVKKNQKIYYAGRVSGNQLINIYFAVDVLVLPSHHDHWGLVINEAMTMSLPVIVSNRVGCIDDLVTDHETGLIIAAENVDELCYAIDFMLKNPKERALMGNNAVLKIADWTLENEASKMCYAWSQLEGCTSVWS